jgi:hypothetical protein
MLVRHCCVASPTFAVCCVASAATVASHT